DRDCIYLIDVKAQKELCQLDSKKNGNEELAFTPDGALLVSGGFSNLNGHFPDGKIRVWRVADGKLMQTLNRVPEVEGLCMALSLDGKTVALGGCAFSVQLWELASGKSLFQEFEGHYSETACFAFSPDGKTLASGGEVSPILLWSTPNWKRSGELPGS